MTSIVTVHLTVTEAEALAELSTLQGLTHESILIQALRHYQTHVMWTRDGYAPRWYDPEGREAFRPVGLPDLGDERA